MEKCLRIITYWYHENFESRSDPRISRLPLMGNPLPLIILVTLYYSFVRSWGPRLMANRKPYNLEKVMIAYNFVQAAINSWFVFEAFRILWIPNRFNLTCQIVDYSNNTEAEQVAYRFYAYTITRLLDFLDTVFIVLRKKDRQNTFLHVYHHIIMGVASWFITKFMAGGHIAFFGTINGFVHSVMYSYYLLTAMYPEYRKNIWWKRHLTQLQLIQFVISGIHHFIVLMNPNCSYPKIVLVFFMSQTIFMFLLFTNFYKNAYMKKKSS